MGVDDARDRDPAPRELLDDHRVGGQVEPHAPVLLGDRDPEQPQLLHLLDDRLGELVLVVELLGDGEDLVVDELAHHLGDRLLLVGLLVVGRACYGHCSSGLLGVAWRASRGGRHGGARIAKDTGAAHRQGPGSAQARSIPASAQPASSSSSPKASAGPSAPAPLIPTAAARAAPQASTRAVNS